jgi:hypothetical protein
MNGLKLNNKSFIPTILCLTTFCFLSILSPANLPAQQTLVSSGETTLTTGQALELVDAILSVSGRLNSERAEQKTLRQRMLLKGVSTDEKNEIEAALSEKRVSISRLEEDIDNLFLGIDTDKLVERKDADFDWSSDLKELVFPLFIELRSFTDRPREIERLKRKIDFLQNKRLKAIDKAVLISSSLLIRLPDVVLAAKEFKAEKILERNALASEIERLKAQLLLNQQTLATIKQRNTETTQPGSSTVPASEVTSSVKTMEKTEVTEAQVELSIKNLIEEIEKQELELVAINGKLAKVEERIKSAGSLKVLLTSETDEWKTERSKTTDELTVNTHRLDELQATKNPLLMTVHEVISVFFKSRGRNIIIGVLLALIFAILFRKAHSWFLTLSVFKFEGQVPFIFRLTDLILHVLSFIGTILVFQIVLYLYDDWLLIVMTFIVIITILWFSIRELPAVWQQVQLILNFGVVRDGERIVVDGIPWKVEKVNVFTQLHNPWLTGARIRLPLHELVNYRSRPANDKEVWFPSKEGNQVLLSDGTFGKVALQTPEYVKIVLYGGTQKTYTTSDYISQTPKNLSAGFSVSVSFGLDYNLQAKVTKEIPEIMRSYLEGVLTDKNFMKDTDDLKVEFKEAGSSSLDLVIITTHKGEIASSYFGLHRLLQRGAVDCCTENNWGIPFPQLTLHGLPDHL